MMARRLAAAEACHFLLVNLSLFGVELSRKRRQDWPHFVSYIFVRNSFE